MLGKERENELNIEKGRKGFLLFYSFTFFLDKKSNKKSQASSKGTFLQVYHLSRRTREEQE